MHTRNAKVVILALTVFAVLAAVVWAGTTVTVTKTFTKSASTYGFDGSYWTNVLVQETNSGYFLTYMVYAYPTWTLVEQGAGAIPSSDVSISATGASLDTDTSSIAVVGDGGDIVLEWSAVDGTGYASSANSWYTYGNVKQFSKGGNAGSQAIVEGTILDIDYTGTGSLVEYKSKVILQTK